MDPTVRDWYKNGLTHRWWALLIRGALAILFGVVAFLMPGSSLFALVVLWGIYAIVDGIFALMLAAQRGRVGLPWGWWLLEGIVGIGAGVFTFFWPGITALFLLTIIAVWALLTGLLEIAAAILLRRRIQGEWVLALSGVLSVTFGILLILFPGQGALALVWLIGSYAILFGVLLMGLGFRIRHWLRKEGSLHSSHHPSPAA